MKMRLTGKRLLATVAAAVLAALGQSVLGPVAPAHADVGCHGDYLSPTPRDSGGYDAEAWWQWESSCWFDGFEMRASFNAYDEVLMMALDPTESFSDVRTYFNVYDSMGVIDTDVLWFSGIDFVDRHQVGTPDGTGNIAEGRTVKFKICGRPANGALQCSAWATGVA